MKTERAARGGAEGKRAGTFAGDCQTDDWVYVGAGSPRPDPHSDVRLENDHVEAIGLNDAE